MSMARIPTLIPWLVVATPLVLRQLEGMVKLVLIPTLAALFWSQHQEATGSSPATTLSPVLPFWKVDPAYVTGIVACLLYLFNSKKHIQCLFVDLLLPLQTDSTEGTSFACPTVAGIVALMLEASNNTLGWRDVQGILAKTAQIAFEDDPSWSVNGAGLSHSDRYGYGIVE